MSAAFVAGAASGIAQGARQNPELSVAGGSFASDSTSLRGADPARAELGVNVCTRAAAAAAAAGIALVSLKNWSRQGRSRPRERAVQPSLVALRASAAEDGELATLPSEEKTADGSISLGQAVTWGGKDGIVRYIGPVKFAVGEWVGLELKLAIGMHDGNIMGVPYFECAPKHGIMAQAVQLHPSAAAETDDEPTTLPSKEKTADGAISLGQTVDWSGKQGTVRYIGPVQFAVGEWVGLELVEAKGMHDGNVLGIPYFECMPKHGIMAEASQLRTHSAAPAIAPPEVAAPVAAPAAAVPAAPASSSLAAQAATGEEIETLPTKEKTADGAISLGQLVAWSGKPGKVRYIGPAKFASGEWVGLELNEAAGVHDGSVLGVPYFICAPKHGVMAQASQLEASGAGLPGAPTAVAAKPHSKQKTVDRAISLGQVMMWSGKRGVVRYIGEVKFAAGEWIGLELAEAKGFNDGAALGIPYFACRAKHGVFAQAMQLQAGEPTSTGAPVTDEGLETLPSKDKTADGFISLGQEVDWCGKRGTVRYIGPVKFAAGEWVGLELAEATGVHDGTVLGIPYFECTPKHGAFAQAKQLQAGGSSPSTSAPAEDVAASSASAAASTAVAAETPEDEEIQTLPSKEMTADGSISLGQTVAWDGRPGIVRYIGPARFAAGEWVGLELYEAAGVHDGSVLGTPYFSCAPKHGVMVQAEQLQAGETVPSAPTSSAASARLTPVAAAAAGDEVAEMPSSKDRTADGRLWLGLVVMWSGAHGIVRYIGPVQFAAGEWVGVEMIEGKGTHDGEVLGIPYFECSPQMGVFAQAAQLKTSGTADTMILEQTIREVEAAAAKKDRR